MKAPCDFPGEYYYRGGHRWAATGNSTGFLMFFYGRLKKAARPQRFGD
jgi:hypothetical protein